MAFVYSSFTEHLAALPADRARHGTALRAAVEQEVRRPSNADLSAFLFLPDQTDHPDHDDAAQVFAQAVEQMYGPRPWIGDEIPLLFVGYHAMNRLSGRRTSQGLLLTDQAIYVQDDFTVLSAAPPLAEAAALPERADDAGAFVAMLLVRYKAWKDWSALADRPEAALSSRLNVLLESAVRRVLDYHAEHASQQHAPQRTWTLSGVIADHGAADTLLDPGNTKLAKKIGKVIDKFQIPSAEPLHFALVDFPLFGGPYGLALSTQALYSKDLMETPVRIALDRIDARSLQLSEKGDEVRNNLDATLTLPAYASASLKGPFLALLQQEILRLQSAR